MSEVSTKNRIISDNNLISMSILADKACRFTDFSNISHNDVIVIMTS